LCRRSPPSFCEYVQFVFAKTHEFPARYVHSKSRAPVLRGEGVPLLKESVVQPRDIRIGLERILAATAVRDNRCDCREKGGRAENANYGKDPKTTPGHHLAYQVRGGALRQVFSFECVLQFCLKLEFWLLLTKLRSDFCGEFQCLKWKRDYVVGVQI
jgi:hypothetical protein